MNASSGCGVDPRIWTLSFAKNKIGRANASRRFTSELNEAFRWTRGDLGDSHKKSASMTSASEALPGSDRLTDRRSTVIESVQWAAMCTRSQLRGAPLVPVMQTADFSEGDDPAG
jgi:hypothetical protein